MDNEQQPDSRRGRGEADDAGHDSGHESGYELGPIQAGAETSMPGDGEAAPPRGSELIDRIGQLTRTLHDSMRELGLDRAVEDAAEAIPDARDRLNYIATMTENAAQTALSAIEVAQPLQEQIEQQASALDERWQAWFEAPVELADARELVRDTREFLQATPAKARQSAEQLHQIMMAQDFQDLTGQVVKKLVTVIREIEQQLIQVLLAHLPEERRPREDKADSLLNGPQVNARRQSDVVTDQAQVDDLLDSLGF